MFVPSYLIDRLTAKWTMVVSMLGYSTYIAAQFAPSFYTLIPAAVVIGFAAAPLWIAKCAYLSQVRTDLSEIDAITTLVLACGISGEQPRSSHHATA